MVAVGAVVAVGAKTFTEMVKILVMMMITLKGKGKLILEQ